MSRDQTLVRRKTSKADSSTPERRIERKNKLGLTSYGFIIRYVIVIQVKTANFKSTKSIGVPCHLEDV